MQTANQKSFIYEKKYLIKRFGGEPIEITAEQRAGIVRSLEAGIKHVTIGEYLLMLNGIQSIDPKYEPDNIPPRPRAKYTGAIEWAGDGTPSVRDENYNLRPAIPSNQKELEAWDDMFGKKKLGGAND